MPYPTKIQPIDFYDPPESEPKCDAAVNPVYKSRFKRLFERPFASVLKTPAPDKSACSRETSRDGNKDESEEFEPSSACLAKMVQNFIEESNDKQQRCERKRCNCFNGNCMENSDEEKDSYNSSFTHAIDVLKSLIPCLSVSEKNLLADTSKIVERIKINKRKDEICRKIVAESLIAVGYSAAICKSKWEKSTTLPAGEHEYIDVTIGSERLIVEIDFKSEFEIARSTKAYKQLLQTLPNIFVGKDNRLDSIITIVSESARQSLKKKGMPFPPWRKAEYVKAKWLSPFSRISPTCNNNDPENKEAAAGDSSTMVKQWEPLEIKPKSPHKGVKIVTGMNEYPEAISGGTIFR
ncbi:uncharacterized protein LOC127258929 isoform X2 [Andrographis paniculata]|uniref:uncharacterized protein LOC127258929 isoform X2 n=1 Tax=Andrographis paniculata TaxID=175694 RepID=UPI0021E8C664|nr:uncharacterized protein LOC127258929 isoform X2 [Andrographis paniculata]